jgi:adenosylmethionine-8-amino-7-oxononanoate aminotransferase
MQIYDAEYLRVARSLTEACGAFLILDEVFTGFGRTGPMWAAEHAAITPDILCLAKGLTGGVLPFAAVVTSERVFEGFLGADQRAFLYGHTFCGNPLGAAVAREVLRIYRDEQILAGVERLGAVLKKGFQKLEALENVSSVRALGMVAALDLAGERGYRERGGWRVYGEALKRGAYLRPLGNVVYVAPPLNISDSELEELLDIVYDSVRAVAAER